MRHKTSLKREKAKTGERHVRLCVYAHKRMCAQVARCPLPPPTGMCAYADMRVCAQLGVLERFVVRCCAHVRICAYMPMRMSAHGRAGQGEVTPGHRNVKTLERYNAIVLQR